jgi:hypothetical protein
MALYVMVLMRANPLLGQMVGVKPWNLDLFGPQMVLALQLNEFHRAQKSGTTLTCPCTRCPATVRPGVSSSPCISGPNGTTSPVTSGSNSHVDLFQVYPL